MIKPDERVYHGELKEGLKEDQFGIKWFDFDRADDKLTKQLTQSKNQNIIFFLFFLLIFINFNFSVLIFSFFNSSEGVETPIKIKKKHSNDKKSKSFRLEKLENNWGSPSLPIKKFQTESNYIY